MICIWFWPTLKTRERDEQEFYGVVQRGLPRLCMLQPIINSLDLVRGRARNCASLLFDVVYVA